MTHKLLIVTTVPEALRGFLLPFAAHFQGLNWQVDAMACGVSTCNDCLQAFDRVWDVTWSRNPFNFKNLLVAVPRIREIVAQGNYDIVHVHTPVAAFVTRYALKEIRKRGKPQIIYTVHGFHFHSTGKLLKNQIFLILEKLGGQWLDYLIVINHEDEQAAQHYQIVAPEKIRYMPGIGVDFEYYNSNSVSEDEVIKLRHELVLEPETPLFLSIAEFIPRKRHQDILRAFAQLKRPEPHLVFAGDGPLINEMKLLATRLGVQKQVHFLGMRQDIPALINISIATILVSEQEGLPRSVMESLCLETPVIGTAIRGTQDLLANSGGILVTVGNIDELAKAMSWILDHPQQAEVMGRQGKQDMSIYDLNYILSLHESLYTEAMANF